MPASFFVYGERGIGKTALVKIVRYIATLKDPGLHDLNLLTSYYAVEDGQDVGSVLQESLNKITDGMDKTIVEKVGGRLGNLFKNGKFEIGAFGASLGVELGSDDSKREITIKDQTVSILSNLLKVVSEDESKKYQGILIIIDETHNLKKLTEVASILRNIVTTLDVENLGKLAFLLVGYEEDMEKFFSIDTSARRTFDAIKIETMPVKEAAEVVSKGLDAAKISYDQGIIERNIGVAGGYPHSIQIIGRHLVEADSDNDISQQDWDDAMINAAIDMRTKEFSQMYSFDKPLTLSDQILVLLAKENRPISKKEISLKLGGKNIYQNLPELKKKGAIKEDSNKNIILQSQLFRTAILVDQNIRVIRARDE